ncbi:MAG: winged helix-turn-helix domain-containing protein [Candidatus Hermodarchaeota archaeon]
MSSKLPSNEINQEKLRTNHNSILVELFRSKMRHFIFLLLSVYNELSLTRISQFTGKSKPTVHHHIQKMIEMGIIEESKEVNEGRPIKVKYYQLAETFSRESGLIQSQTYIEEESPEKRFLALKRLFAVYRSTLLYLRNSIGLLERYLEDFESKIPETQTDAIDWEKLELHPSKGAPFLVSAFLSDTELKEFTNLFLEFFKKVRQKRQESHDDDLKGEISHQIFLLGLPIKKMLEKGEKLF